MLTPDEKWFFDHHGFIILRKVVPPEDIERMVEIGNRWHDMTLDELPPPLTSTSRDRCHFTNNCPLDQSYPIRRCRIPTACA